MTISVSGGTLFIRNTFAPMVLRAPRVVSPPQNNRVRVHRHIVFHIRVSLGAFHDVTFLVLLEAAAPRVTPW